LANGQGWGFDGMDSSMFGLVSPLIIKEFALDVPTYRSGLQIALLVGIAGLYFWPWLSDRYGRRTLLAIAQDRKRRIAETLSAGSAVNEDDRAWIPAVLGAIPGIGLAIAIAVIEFLWGGILGCVGSR
jgi:MFS family permease